MLRDAAGLRLLIDRHKPEVSCRAQHDAGATWLVEPMFNAPLPPRTEPLPCSTSACSDGAGRPTPCLDEAGQPIPDQPSRGASAAPAGGEQAP
jgi:hypothetical protein